VPPTLASPAPRRTSEPQCLINAAVTGQVVSRCGGASTRFHFLNYSTKSRSHVSHLKDNSALYNSAGTSAPCEKWPGVTLLSWANDRGSKSSRAAETLACRDYFQCHKSVIVLRSKPIRTDQNQGRVPTIYSSERCSYLWSDWSYMLTRFSDKPLPCHHNLGSYCRNSAKDNVVSFEYEKVGLGSTKSKSRGLASANMGS